MSKQILEFQSHSLCSTQFYPKQFYGLIQYLLHLKLAFYCNTYYEIYGSQYLKIQMIGFYNSLQKILWRETNQSTFIELINIGRFKNGFLRVRLDGKQHVAHASNISNIIFFLPLNSEIKFQSRVAYSIEFLFYGFFSVIFCVIESSVIVNRIMENQTCEKLIS